MPDQRVLSYRVKSAIKTALATVLAYGVALSMDWEHAYWAAFAVALVYSVDWRYGKSAWMAGPPRTQDPAPCVSRAATGSRRAGAGRGVAVLAIAAQ